MIYIRADGNKTIGMGHLMRCLSIANALKEQGEKTCFILADSNGESLIRSRGYETRVLNTDYTLMEQENEGLQSLLGSINKPVVLVDSYFVTPAYFENLKVFATVFYMDDLGDSCYQVDGLINYNLYGPDMGYEQTYQAQQKQVPQLLLGAEFAPIRSEFNKVSYQIRDKVKQVMITTGGGDQYNIAGRLITEISSHTEWRDIRFLIISGPFNVHSEELKEAASLQSNVEVLENVTNMSEVMVNSDIAVTATGSTVYEMCAVGIPVICFYFVENQRRIAQTLSRITKVVNAGNYPQDPDGVTDHIFETMRQLIGSTAARESLQQELNQITDGQGAYRIAEILIGEVNNHSGIE